MADSKYELMLKIAADIGDIRKASGALTELGNKFATIRQQVSQGFLINFGGGIGNRIKNVFDSALPAYIKQENAERGLAAAMNISRTAANASFESFKRLASQMQSITTLGDETVLGIEKMALNMGVAKDRMRECVQGAIGLQKAYGLGLNEAVKAAAAVVQGKTEKLNELIPALRNCASTEEKLKLANDAMRRGFVQAKEESETLGGTLAQLSNAWGDVSEVVGESAAPAVKTVAGILKSLAETIAENRNGAVFLTRSLTGALAAFSLKKLGTHLGMLAKLKDALSDGGDAATAAAASLGKTERAMQSLVNATAALKGVSAGGVLGALLSPAGLIAAGAAVAYVGGEYAKLCEIQKEAQKRFEDFSAQAESRSRSLIDTFRQQGASFDEVLRAEKSVQLEIDGLYRMRRIAEADGYDTTAIENSVAAHRKILSALTAERDQYAAIAGAKRAAFENEARGDLFRAREKYAATQLSDAQKLDATAEKIALKKSTLADLEKKIADASGEQKARLAANYKLETDILIALEAEQKTVRAKVEAEKKAADERSRALKQAIERADKMEAEYVLEMEILATRRSGGREELERLETERETRRIASQIFEAQKARCTNAQELKQLEADALERAANRVKLERQAVAAERERQNLKNREKSVEDYLWRIKIAQAKMRGDEDGAKKLEQQRQMRGEVSELVKQGFSPDRALQIVAQTTAAEEAAQPAQDGGDIPRNRPLRGNAPRRAATATVKRGADGKIANGFESPIDRFQRQKANAKKAETPIDRFLKSRMPAPKNSGIVRAVEPPKNTGGETQIASLDSKVSELVSLFRKIDTSLSRIKTNTAATAGNTSKRS